MNKKNAIILCIVLLIQITICIILDTTLSIKLDNMKIIWFVQEFLVILILNYIRKN